MQLWCLVLLPCYHKAVLSSCGCRNPGCCFLQWCHGCWYILTWKLPFYPEPTITLQSHCWHWHTWPAMTRHDQPWPVMTSPTCWLTMGRPELTDWLPCSYVLPSSAPVGNFTWNWAELALLSLFPSSRLVRPDPPGKVSKQHIRAKLAL